MERSSFTNVRAGLEKALTDAATYANAWKLMGKFSAEEPSNVHGDVDMVQRGNNY